MPRAQAAAQNQGPSVVLTGSFHRLPTGLASSADIAFALSGDVHRNSRALRQLEALSKAGYSVLVLSLPGGDVTSILPARVEHRPIPVRPGSGPGLFFRLHRAFGRELENVRATLFHASDLYVLPASREAAGRRRARLSYDARELYGHVSATVGRPHVRAFWTMVERLGIRKADRVWTVSDSIADHLAGTYRIPRPTVQLNAPAIHRLAADDHLSTAVGEYPILLHLGQLRKDRGADLLIDAMAAWPNWDPGRSARLVFMGYGPERVRLETRVHSEHLTERIVFLDPISPARLPSVASRATAGITLLEPTCLNHRYALPNKLFDYLAAGLPVITSDLVECGRIVRDYDCGIAVDPLDRGGLLKALQTVTSDHARAKRWGRNAKAASETLDWSKASVPFAEQVTELIGPPSLAIS